MLNLRIGESSFTPENPNSTRRKQGKRKLANLSACKTELKKELRLLFKTFSVAIENSNMRMSLFKPSCKARSLDATIVQSCFAEQLFENFGENAYWGKYKRLILKINGYLILFKKLDKNGHPMNIMTANVQSILRQSQVLDLFADSNYSEDPILYFGYQKDRLGNYVNPQLIYVDEGFIQFSICESDIDVEIGEVHKEEENNGVMPKLKGKGEDRASRASG